MTFLISVLGRQEMRIMDYLMLLSLLLSSIDSNTKTQRTIQKPRASTLRAPLLGPGSRREWTPSL